MSRGRPPVIKIGDRFGRLEVIGRSDFVPFPYIEAGSLWCVRCDCGGEKIVAARNLSSGNTRSCGCLQRQRASLHQKAAMSSEEALRRGALTLFTPFETVP